MAVEIIDSEVLEDFQSITSIDIESYFSRVEMFLETDQQNILDYYGGITDDPNSESFRTLSELISETKGLFEVINLSSNAFQNYSYWILLEKLELIENTLESVDESSRYLRSAITKNSFNSKIEIDYTLIQNQVLEDVSKNVLDSDDFNNDWTEIAIINDIDEEDYTHAGGNTFKISFQNNNNSLFLTSVIDNINTGEKTWGLDLNRKITFVDEDFNILSYKDTVIQAVEIKALLKKGDNTQFPEDGVQSSFAVGSNFRSIAFPLILRQLYFLFQKDDSLRSFTVTSIRNEKDAVFLDFEVETRYEEVVAGQIQF